MRPLPAILALLLGAGCGYRFVNGGASHDPAGPFTVAMGVMHTPSMAAVDAALDGARAELGRVGELAGTATGEGAVVDLEVLRIDEEGEGIALVHRPSGNLPLARGLRLTVVGRAAMHRAGADAHAERETGDVAVSEVIARDTYSAESLVARDDAVRRAARRLGERLVRRILGYPDPSER